MSAFEVYKQYVALKLHFTTNYDYFEYDGKTTVNSASFEKRKDKAKFLRISKSYNPETFLIGNFLFGEKIGWVGSFEPKHQTTYETYLQNGQYLFREQLSKLNSDFNSNFSLAFSSVPYIIEQYLRGEVTLHTCCVFNQVLGCVDKWRESPQFLIFEKTATKIHNATPFFKIDSAKYKALMLKQFS